MMVRRTPEDTGGGDSPESPESWTDAVPNLDLENLDRRVRSFVREQPLLSLGIAVAAGYLVGRLLSRT